MNDRYEKSFLEAPGTRTVFLDGPVMCQMTPGTTKRL
jgi:hypothetical protein